MGFLMQNLPTLAVGAAVLLVIGCAIAKLVKDKKKGKGSCSCGSSCSGCPSAGLCHPNPVNDSASASHH